MRNDQKPIDAPLVLSSPDRGLRLLDDFEDVIGNLKELAAFGMIEMAICERVDRDLRAVVKACFARTLN